MTAPGKDGQETPVEETSSSGIGTLAENSLHASLKQWYARPGDQLEVKLEGYFIDLVRGEQLIEIQTRNFSAMKIKLKRLLEHHPVRLVHPIAQEKWIIRMPVEAEKPASRRKSPRRGKIEHLFLEMVRIPDLINHPNFSVEVLFTREEEILRQGANGTRRTSWRRKGWSIVDRRLVSVESSVILENPGDFLALLPADLNEPFTARQLASALSIPPYLAQKMVYSLRLMGALEISGHYRRSRLYQRASQFAGSTDNPVE